MDGSIDNWPARDGGHHVDQVLVFYWEMACMTTGCCSTGQCLPQLAPARPPFAALIRTVPVTGQPLLQRSCHNRFPAIFRCRSMSG
jgi:hypothetical protein